MPEQILGNSPFSMRSRRSSSSVSSDTLKQSSDGGGAGMSEGGWVRRKRRSRIPVRQATGLYVHSSPPTVVPVHPSVVRQWLRGGEINRLQEIVLTKKIDELHAAARVGDIERIDATLKSEPRINLEMSTDRSGTGLLHKAVIHDHSHLQEWLLSNYPKTVEVLDKEKRNPLHYAGGNEEVWNRLVAGGADTSTVDREGNSPAFYMNHPRRLRPPAPESRKPQASRGIVVKPSNIRIWIHDKDLGRLQKVLWEGMGDKLKSETSSQPLVRRFLNAVPYILGSIRDVHSAAVNNDVELLKSKSSDPVPKDILLSKDANGLNALHKAAGLGHMEVARAIIDRAPDAVNSKDNLDRTPLHYAAALKDQNQMYQLLVDSNATDHLEDMKGNTPSHYRARPQDLDGPKLLNVVPDAPRTAHIFPPSWDWRLLNGDMATETPIVSPQVEAPPPIPDAKEPEEPEKQVEERQVDDKPPEIEPSPEELPEQEILSEQEESKDAKEPPGISDDEGVGSEANPSVENTSTPLSDTVNEEEEISGARLGETMTLTTSLFSSKASRTEESVNGTDSGNEDGDQPENNMIYGEEPPQVHPSSPLLSNLQATTDNDDDITFDDKIEGVVNEEQDIQNESENPRDIIREVTDDQILRITPDTTNSGKDDEKPESGMFLPEADANVRSGDGEGGMMTHESAIREDETENLEGIMVDNGEQTDNQNNILNSASINIEAEESAKYEEESVEIGETRDSNQTVGNTQDLNATFTKTPSNDEKEVEKDAENDTDTPFNQNEYSTPVDSIPSQGDTMGEEREGSPENNSSLVEGSRDSEGADVAQNQEDEQAEPEENEFNVKIRPASRKSEVGIPPESVSASNSRPSSQRSRIGTARSRPGSPANKSNQGEIDNKETNLENEKSNLLEAQLEGDNVSGLENSTGISKEPEDGTDSGAAVRSELEPVEMVDEGAMLESQVESHEIVEITGGSQESSNTMIKEEDDQGNETPFGVAETDGDSFELLDRPVTTRSAGGSRAEILAITPAPPDEEDAIDGDDQKAVEGNGEEDRAVAEELVAAGDMESMAEMVLNGRGSALLNMSSTNSDVQLFINNIPQYIAKIERVHVAAREGDLRGVQTALDRRKFAVARDNSTPLKPTPLHIAALFGRTSVLRYLAGRFPETMHAKDAGGRTALHYAATLPDNGHFYSLLVTLGADKSVIDNEGRTAEYYLKNRGELSRDELLNEYQNRPVPIDTSGLNFNRFSDKGYWQWNNETKQYLQVPQIGAELIKGGYPIFNPEEGQYLADSLGEPLIKGLTEVAHVRPKNPVVHLANYLLVYNKPEEGGGNNNRFPSGKRAVTAGMEDAPTEVTDTNEGEEFESVADQLMDGETTGNEEMAVDEVEKGGDTEEVGEVEEKEDEEETLDDDNASVEGDPLESVEPAFKPTNRDEHGQTILHFAAARSHGRNAIFQLLQEMDVNVGLRDGLYRTARDISEQMEISENVQGIDKFVVALAARGENDKLTELLLEGYDHIQDAEDGENIMDIANERENVETVELLQGITAFEERREKLIRAIRFGSMRQVREIFQEAPNKRHLAIAKNQQGRCSLHVAVLAQHENIVEYIAKRFPATLHTGDNLMRAPLHYAMGVEKVEPLSRILIAAGAQRVVKDLKGRQPSYYFMSKTDIKKLQDEEEALRV